MKTPVQLIKGTGEIVLASICPMNEKHLEDIQNLWQGMLAEAEQVDDGWAWEYKLRQSQQSDRHEAYVVEEENLTHGLIYIETQWHRSQFPHRKPLVYIETINSAPWNRIEIEDPPYLKGVGKALLLFSRQRSLKIGFGGRVGLHALPGTERFYRRQQMPEYEPDAEKEGLIYFEYGTLRQ